MNNDLASRLHFDTDVRNHAADVAKQLLRLRKPFIQFGAGITGEKVYHFLKEYGLTPVCFCDNNPAKQYAQIDEIMVYPLRYIMENFRDYYFLISCDAFLEISRQLLGAGVCKEDILYIEPDWLNSPNGQGEYIKEHLKEFEKAYRLLCDNKSRDVFTGLLNYKITHELKYVEPFADLVPYFDDDLVSIGINEVFVDCGAFIGDTLIDFVKYCDGNYRKVYCFEPNLENVELLNKCVENNGFHDIEIIPYGLSDKKQKLFFEGNSENGRISDGGSLSVECDTIDNILYEKENRVTFIKMDIEGSEYYALEGAKKIIQRDHPKLAICVYHRVDDYFVLTHKIKELWSGYCLYFRQYELSGEETVCYAIPEKQ